MSRSSNEEALDPGPGTGRPAPFAPRGYYGDPGNPWLQAGPAVPLRWAKSRSAEEFLIFSRTANDYIPLPRDED